MSRRFEITTLVDNLSLLVPDWMKDDYREVLTSCMENHNGYVTVQISTPKKSGTEEQNRAFHALINEFWLTGCSSYPNYETMRDSYKLRAGGAKEYKIATENGVVTSKTLEGYEGYISIAIPKSWSEFNREQRMKAIDLVLADIYQSGASSKKLDEIIGGLDG
jgi:transposase-like protein